MAITRHISHIKSKLTENGGPKLPAAGQLLEGEIAVNYAKGYETLSIKNESGDVVTFSSDNATPWEKGSGANSAVLKGGSNIASAALSVAEGGETSATSAYSHAEGYKTKANASYTHAEGDTTTASGTASHAEGSSTAAKGNQSHAEGQNSIASGTSSHAEGQTTKAIGNYSHSEGRETTASGYSSHAEGYIAFANGTASHAEGYDTAANGSYSHAEGQGTNTVNDYEHASGKNNISSKANTTFGNSGNTLFSVGNGYTANDRHNVIEIRQNGDIYIVDVDNGSGDTYYTKGMLRLQDALFTENTELVISSALNDLNERKLDASAYTPISIDQEISSGTSASTNAVSTKAVFDVIKENEEIISSSLNDLNDRIIALEEIINNMQQQNP